MGSDMGMTRAGHIPGQLTWANNTAVNLCFSLPEASVKSFSLTFCALYSAAILGHEHFILNWENKCFFVLTIHSDYEFRLIRFDCQSEALLMTRIHEKPGNSTALV